jgi:hypothetical protein
MNTTASTLMLIDLGDAIKHTRQQSPTPPIYADSLYGLGAVPDPPDGAP